MVVNGFSQRWSGVACHRGIKPSNKTTNDTTNIFSHYSCAEYVFDVLTLYYLVPGGDDEDVTPRLDCCSLCFCDGEGRIFQENADVALSMRQVSLVEMWVYVDVGASREKGGQTRLKVKQKLI